MQLSYAGQTYNRILGGLAFVGLLLIAGALAGTFA